MACDGMVSRFKGIYKGRRQCRLRAMVRVVVVVFQIRQYRCVVFFVCDGPARHSAQNSKPVAF
jgi:hypothetical protein